MASVPVCLDVLGNFFKATHKYYNSVAMVLDSLDNSWANESTGDVEFPYGYVSAFYEVSVADAYKIVSEYIDEEQVSGRCEAPTWREARQMIDVIEEGRNWLVSTNSQGFVTAACFGEMEDAKAEFKAVQSAYELWSEE